MGRVLNDIIYQKGGWTLHMLRNLVGTDTFWTAIRKYYAQYRDASASTADLQRVFEETSGQPLGWFFDQWLRRAGSPMIAGSWRYDATAKQIEVTLDQTEAGTPYRLPLDIGITVEGAAMRTEHVEFTQAHQSWRFAAGAAAVCGRARSGDAAAVRGGTVHRRQKLRGSAMPKAPKLILRLLDSAGKPIEEDAVVMIRQMGTGVVKSVRSEGKDPVAVSGLESGANGLYRVEVDPAAYLPSGAFARLLSDDTDLTMNFAIDAARVKDVEFPAFAKLGGELRDLLKASKQVLGFEKKPAQDIYDGIDAIRRAGLLNIIRKCAATSLPNGRVVSSYLTELFELRGDRFFCGVPQALREDVKNAVPTGLFEPVPEGLHHPPVGFEHAGSFKTADHYGNSAAHVLCEGRRVARRHRHRRCAGAGARVSGATQHAHGPADASVRYSRDPAAPPETGCRLPVRALSLAF